MTRVRLLRPCCLSPHSDPHAAECQLGDDDAIYTSDHCDENWNTPAGPDDSGMP
jgi:hypothetical protein